MKKDDFIGKEVRVISNKELLELVQSSAQVHMMNKDIEPDRIDCSIIADKEKFRFMKSDDLELVVCRVTTKDKIERLVYTFNKKSHKIAQMKDLMSF